MSAQLALAEYMAVSLVISPIALEMLSIFMVAVYISSLMYYVFTLMLISKTLIFDFSRSLGPYILQWSQEPPN